MDHSEEARRALNFQCIISDVRFVFFENSIE